MCNATLVTLSIALLAGDGGRHAPRAVPYPAALDGAAIEQDRLDSILDHALILGNGDINGLVFSEGGAVRIRLAKNDVWDARFDTSNDPEPLTIQRIRELAKTDWLKGGAFGGGYLNPDGSPYRGSGGWGKPYPCPVACADIVIGTPAARWRRIRAQGKHNAWERRGDATVMSISGAVGASNGYSLPLPDVRTDASSRLRVRLSGSENARYFIDVLGSQGEVVFHSKWQETPTAVAERSFPLSADVTCAKIILYTWTEDGARAENRFESVSLGTGGKTHSVDLACVLADETCRSRLDIGKAVAHVDAGEDRAAVDVRMLADRNTILIHTQAGVSLEAAKVSFLPDATAGETDSVSWLHRRLPGDENGDWPGMEYAVAVASSTRHHAVTIVTSLDAADVVARAAKLAREALQTSTAVLVREHEGVWRRFWEASGIELADEILTRAWYRNLYFFRCVSKPGVACPGLFAGVVGATSAWHGGHTMNYNAQQTYWTPFITNHPELAEPYVRMIAEYRPRARWLCGKLFGFDGTFYPHNIFVHEPPDPTQCKSRFGRQFFWMSWSYTHGVSPFAVQNLWYRYKYAPDREYLEGTAYPAVKEVAVFCANFVDSCERTGGGKVVLAPTVSPEHHGWTHKLRYNRNCTFDIAMFRFVMTAAIEGATKLGRDANLVARWKEALDRLPPYPTTTGDDPVVVDVQDAPPLNYNITVPTTPVFPGDLITWRSPRSEQELFARTIGGIRWNGNNSAIILSVGRARLSMPGTADWVRGELAARQRPNGTITLNRLGHHFNDAGHYTEQFAAAMAISELLLQSVGDIVRVFPAWPTDKPARFSDLRAQGGFLVSAAQDGAGHIAPVTVRSTVGGKLRLRSPWPVAALSVLRGDRSERIEADGDEIVTIDTAAGETLVLRR